MIFYDTLTNLLPINCPATANPMKNGIQIAGVCSQILKGMIKGMEACIKNHHLNVNLRYFIRRLPKKIFTVNATADTAKIFIIRKIIK
jgi:hypothetical protein